MPLPRIRGTRWRGGRVAACAGAAALLGLTVVPLTAPAGAASQFNTFSASVTGVAHKQTYGALSTADDPGTAATQASVGVSPGYNGQTEQLEAKALNADPGTLAGAVLFAAPDCTGFSD